jgi:hypothetical protein
MGIPQMLGYDTRIRDRSSTEFLEGSSFGSSLDVLRVAPILPTRLLPTRMPFLAGLNAACEI